MNRTPIAVWRAGRDDLAAHLSIRHQVFVEEQGVLVITDVDRWDSDDQVVHVLAAQGDSIGGAVRLYPLEAGRWKGDRLAVLPPYRASWMGAHLVRFALVTAAAAGGSAMEANVQVPNVRFFERLGWRRDGDLFQFHGLAHQPMLFDLAEAPTLDVGTRPACPRLVLDTAPAVSALLEPV